MTPHRNIRQLTNSVGILFGFVVIFCSVFVPAGWFVGCHNDEDDEEASLYLCSNPNTTKMEEENRSSFPALLVEQCSLYQFQQVIEVADAALKISRQCNVSVAELSYQ
jgi:hypothetical protein